MTQSSESGEHCRTPPNALGIQRGLLLAGLLAVVAGQAHVDEAVGQEAALTRPVVKDAFGRDLTAPGITLVDWQGYIANPAPRFSIAPPPEAAFPARITLRAVCPRLYFDLPSTVGAEGPRKELALRSAEDRPSFRLCHLARPRWPE